jgi:hypothetical protein
MKGPKAIRSHAITKSQRAVENRKASSVRSLGMSVRNFAPSR